MSQDNCFTYEYTLKGGQKFDTGNYENMSAIMMVTATIMIPGGENIPVISDDLSAQVSQMIYNNYMSQAAGAHAPEAKGFMAPTWGLPGNPANHRYLKITRVDVEYARRLASGFGTAVAECKIGMDVPPTGVDLHKFMDVLWRMARENCRASMARRLARLKLDPDAIFVGCPDFTDAYQLVDTV